MKKVILLLVTFISIKVLCQKNFEGIIVYQTVKPGINSKMTMFFGKFKIKIVSTMSYEDSLQKFTQTTGGIFDFSSGTTTQYSSFNKLYKIDTINKEEREDRPAKIERKDSAITIAGIMCNKYFLDLDTINKTDISKTYTWYSDEMEYIVPEKYRTSLSPTSFGNLLFMGSTQIISYYHPFAEKKIIDTITTIAVSVQKKKLKKRHFSIPRNYKSDDGAPGSTWDIMSRQYEKSLKAPAKKPDKQKSGNN